MLPQEGQCNFPEKENFHLDFIIYMVVLAFKTSCAIKSQAGKPETDELVKHQRTHGQ